MTEQIAKLKASQAKLPTSLPHSPKKSGIKILAEPYMKIFTVYIKHINIISRSSLYKLATIEQVLAKSSYLFVVEIAI